MASLIIMNSTRHLHAWFEIYSHFGVVHIVMNMLFIIFMYNISSQHYNFLGFGEMIVKINIIYMTEVL